MSTTIPFAKLGADSMTTRSRRRAFTDVQEYEDKNEDPFR